MRGLVVYASHYGTTRQYAVWIATELGFECIEAVKGIPDPSGYDCIIMGGSVYAGGWLLRKWVEQHAGILVRKRVYGFTVSTTPPEKTGEHDAVVLKNLPKNLQEGTPFWHFGGAIDVGKLRFFHRILFRMVMSMSKSPDAGEHKRNGVDYVSRGSILPLLERVKDDCRQN
ncbi:MAG TPA: flavodoxin domain-containing protein [Spirochaetota bacterium]|nr:flavodoxin domain-containing protein [Spirochaetota bacterium]